MEVIYVTQEQAYILPVVLEAFKTNNNLEQIVSIVNKQTRGTNVVLASG